jgi:urea transport system permease protein
MKTPRRAEGLPALAAALLAAALLWPLAGGAAAAAAAPAAAAVAPPADAHPDAHAGADADIAVLLQQVAAADYAGKRDLIDRLAQTADPRVRPVLAAWLAGTLVARAADGHLYLAEADGVQLRDPLSGALATATAVGETAPVDLNNLLRKTLRVALAQFDLADPSAAVRRAAVKEMLRVPDPAVLAALRARAPHETDPAVQAELAAGLALADLDSPDAERRLAAVGVLKGDLNPEVYNRLSELVQVPSDGPPAEPDARVRAAAAGALRAIDSARTLYAGVQTLVFGLSQGSILVLAAIGLAITFGVMGVINMAHGELMMLGAYATYLVQQLMPGHIGASILVAIPVAFVVSGLVGVAIERGIVRHLYGRPLETLLATFGVSLLLQQAVRDIFSANNRSVVTPEWLAGSLEINEALSITYNHLYIIVFTFAVFGLLQLVLRHTRFGLEVRAVSQNRAMARAMGIRTEWIDAMTFGMGSGIAGVAGVALSQITNVGPNLGQSYIVDSFMVVVFGGVGNLWGTLIGGNALGVVNKLLEPFSGAVLAKIFVLVFLILFIQRRPRGLFPQRGRAAEG